MKQIKQHLFCLKETRGGGGIFCLFFWLILFADFAFAITEAQFIEKVLAQDKLLEEAQIGLDIKQIELGASRDNYQNWKTNLFFDLSYRYKDSDRDTTSTGIYTKKQKDTKKKISLDFEKRFLSNPSSLKIGISRSDDKAPIQRYKQRDYYDSHEVKNGETKRYINFNYPLLKHDSNAVSLKTYRKDIIDLKRQQLLFYETKEDFLSNRLRDYLLWILYQKQVQINDELLHRLRRLNPKNDKETALLKSAAYQTEQYIADTNIQLRAIKEKLSVLLNDKTILTKIPEFDLHKRVELIQGVSDYLQTHNRTLQRIFLDIALKRIDIKYYKNQGLPDLDFALKAEKNLNNGNTRSSIYDDDRTIYTVGLAFNYPLSGNISNQANLKKTLLGVKKLQIAYQDKQQNISADIQLLHTLLTLNEDKLLYGIDAATQSVKIEHKNYQLGQTSLRDLLSAYREERIAKLDYIGDVIDYQINSIEYNNLLDRIISTP